ncbi:MAG: hypothetical protein ABR76_02475 [Acidimicrobiia bacterium BACL6 MAG-121220-bin61]|nr:MAG: hypothetical protein ABR78_05890 [Acidimicrobiia bacterium BACL6 MAG-120910-bin40]KRO56327.1 MAG: hypothetical protein ABR77_05195 [Acidimicrobiia bacterium BACL6 MAG-120322-bin79]KRO61885.1 MAG: hypothetical protein ABR76_02475 [Acidimicrobiia bacterium BACL6 MAG-121220-bin61]
MTVAIARLLPISEGMFAVVPTCWEKPMTHFCKVSARLAIYLLVNLVKAIKWSPTPSQHEKKN